VEDWKPIEIFVLYHMKVDLHENGLFESKQSMPSKPIACLAVNTIAMATISYILGCIRIYAFLHY